MTKSNLIRLRPQLIAEVPVYQAPLPIPSGLGRYDRARKAKPASHLDLAAEANPIREPFV
jgi:hypothetical protein